MSFFSGIAGHWAGDLVQGGAGDEGPPQDHPLPRSVLSGPPVIGPGTSSEVARGTKVPRKIIYAGTYQSVVIHLAVARGTKVPRKIIPFP